MAGAIFAFASAMILFAGASQIELPWLRWTQFGLGVIFALSGAAAGWAWARDR